MHIEENRSVVTDLAPRPAIVRLVELAAQSSPELGFRVAADGRSMSARFPVEDGVTIGGEGFVTIAAAPASGGSTLSVTVGYDLPDSASIGYSYGAKVWANGLARALAEQLGNPGRGVAA